ncbi:polyprenyl P-hydroxybenzoate and phenylacrylic acid decarboxylases subfamily [Aciduliprofundum boonei T469]|nr:polyprenyl P-hydroxybenzoate and phenylacrylic acid decarboxylases subfamily [Aciduliprofundum boonei T469]
MKIIVGITGASGSILGIKLLESLKAHDVSLILSENAKKIIKYETDYKEEDLINLSSRIYNNNEMEADIASGTTRFDSLVIVPCSTSTLSKIACGIADNLITRVASVALKERRKVILVPRETPLSPIILENMLKLSKIGVEILPPVPAFYLKPKKIDDVVNYIVGKILDTLGIEHELYKPYSPQ